MNETCLFINIVHVFLKMVGDTLTRAKYPAARPHPALCGTWLWGSEGCVCGVVVYTGNAADRFDNRFHGIDRHSFKLLSSIRAKNDGIHFENVISNLFMSQASLKRTLRA